MRRKSALLTICLIAIAVLAAVALAQETASGGGEGRRLEVEAPDLLLTDTPWILKLRPSGDDWPAEVDLRVEVGSGEPFEETLFEETVELREDGTLVEEVEVTVTRTPESGTTSIDVYATNHARVRPVVRVIPGWLSILPPLLAILFAIVFREVVVALGAGVWLGATMIHGYDPLVGLLRTVDRYAVGALADADHASIAIFSLVLGGMIGVIARSGGAQGMAVVVTRVAKNRLSGALATWLMGLAIFFDDYSNSLLVGTTMRPITDRLKISREKLAFIVDATAAPVSSFAIISSWVGVEVGYISDQYSQLGIEGDPYLVFLQTIPFRFYPILMLWFGLLLILTKRDFGPMWKAERRALVDGDVIRPGSDPASDFDAKELQPPKDKPPRWINAALPIAAVILTAMIGMYTTGHDALVEARAEARVELASATTTLEAAGNDATPSQHEAVSEAERALSLTGDTLSNIFGKASSLKALLWAAFIGGLLAILLAISQRILTLRQAMESWVAGARSISLAVMILVLAWSLGEVCTELHTADWVIRGIGGWLPPELLPAVVFLIAAGVSFATGTSWGTMGILFPLVVPLAHRLAEDEPVLILSSVASILSGSVWGDHCSPISDTTIMSSMASSCDHVDHVRTQLPYAMAVGGVSLVFGELATGVGLYGAWVALLLGAIALFVLVRFVGRKLPTVE